MIAAFSYLGSGILYGIYILDSLYDEALWSFFSCLLGWAIFRPRAIKNAPILKITLATLIKQKLIFLSFAGICSMFLFFAINGLDYFSADKVERSGSIASSFILRPPFYAFIVCLVILYSDTSNSYKKIKSLFFYILLLISVIEMNRELIILSGIIFLIRFNKIYGKLLIPKGITGFVLIMTSTVFVLIFLKPIMYIFLLGIPYDGGFFNYGETVNWYRWLDYSITRDTDIASVQRNDFLYSIYSIFLPYNPVDSASKIWFIEVLGNAEEGRTYGYSGVLWLSYYLTGPSIALGWMFLFFIYSSKFSNNQIIQIIIYIGLLMVTYRFFRSEWPLVLKTILWTFIYPSFIFYYLSRLSIKNIS